MSYRYEKETQSIVWSGFDKGIASSPHKGIANMQSVNISTDSGEAMCSFARTQQSQTNTSATGTFSAFDSTHLQVSGIALTAGVWVTVTSTTITGLSTGNYYVTTLSNTLQLATTFGGSPISGLGLTGTAQFVLIRNIGKPIASATETYNDGTTTQYRYYILDANGLVWVNDSASLAVGLNWFLPDPVINYFTGSNPTGVAVLNGWLMVFSGNQIYCKSTVRLGNDSTTTTWLSFSAGIMNSVPTTSNIHNAVVTHTNILYYTDGDFIGSIFPSTSLLSGANNVQSFASYTSSTTTGTIATLIYGEIPYANTPAAITGSDGSVVRVPATFFTAVGGTQPSNLAVGTIYYIEYAKGAGTFGVYSALTGGSAININTAAAGTQYFNTFNPSQGGTVDTFTFLSQRLALPHFEVAQSIAESGTNILIGCKGNTLYSWNQIDATPTTIIPLPESNVMTMVTVGNLVEVFAGSKGNIYITNGSVASLALTVPDYCAGIAGTPSSYIEPYFTWGGAIYLRGRVYCSILDQTASKAGNCGGIWSFIPTNNMYIGDDIGISLRQENQSSYGTYNGVSTVLLASQNQNAISPQYWNGWYSSISSPLYGIDFTSTTPSTTAIIETDIVPTGTFLDKLTFRKVEYKLSSPLISGESVALFYRLNSTDSYTSCGTLVVESVTGLSGYYNVNFEKTQWIQIKSVSTPITSASSSFVRIKELRISE